MQNERKRILTMLENGTISMDEALTLLEAMEKTAKDNYNQADEVVFNENKSDQGNDQSYSKNRKDPSMDEFIEDIKKDFVTVGDRFMQFMQTAVDKMKGFDFDKPFGGSTTFHHSIVKEADDLEEILIDVDNGNISVHATDATEIKADFVVKAYGGKSEEDSRKEFLDKLIFLVDEGKLRLLSDLKLIQVNVDLFIPKQDYKKISARLLNGHFSMNDITVDRFYTKTANGKVDLERIDFKEAEIEAGNGSIRLNESSGELLEAETINGRVYLSGQLKDVEAKSLNGNVIVTTNDTAAQRIDAKTVSGTVEVYIPSDIPLHGEISTNMGRLDLQLKDVTKSSEQEQFLQRSISFSKTGENGATPLYIHGEAKTGSVIVCYTVKHD
ncbi:DUF4097 family beta strand repeat-containing protein [Sporosarcina thermotolerans]|uniref:DUF4097 family beta strand repeat-containing protein n=1 Tax=Sporosarcina thermotolerans TaxID=633404 RepID=A0AAW9ABS4_9BACL|nr:DUF4097 family beta strand repeat-containing protein [Sporosarcina thermotolerans]MDW0118400.1 DUF4097 family beta strand repeat-containing protein [Sporosarcina thermotolerans]